MTINQAIFKLVHSDESKLEKASFTGSCYALGNPKAAIPNVKKSYQKCLNAWSHYWKAMLISAWENMKEDHPETKDRLAKALEEYGRDAFMTELRFVASGLC